MASKKENIIKVNDKEINIDELSFEESLKYLEEIVRRLETGEVPLDNAIEEFNNAMKLSKSCDLKLKSAETAITKLVKDNDEMEDFSINEG